ncbi:hypothetical protein ACGGX0_001505 [Salmonella enterica]
MAVLKRGLLVGYCHRSHPYFVEDGATRNSRFCRIEPTNTIMQYFTIDPETHYHLTLVVRGEAKASLI